MALSLVEFRKHLIYETGHKTEQHTMSHCSKCGFSDLSKLLVCVQGKTKLACLEEREVYPGRQVHYS